MRRAAVTSGIRVHVPAKVNLHLSVGPRRPDGYHDLVTVFHAVELLDTVRASPAGELSLTVEGDGVGDVPTDHTNLAWKAAQLLADTAGISAHAALHLTKHIPVGGGMAGGSADAAGALVACAALWDLDVGPTELTALAARLGSDVAFPLLGGTALGTGRGEVLDPVPVAGELDWVFATADFEIRAGAAYDALDRRREAGTADEPIGPPDALLAALEAGDPRRVAAHLGNDLQPVALALAPQLQDTLDAGIEGGALAGLVSGSGPTCAFLCADVAVASALSVTLRQAGVCSRAIPVRSPHTGARVVS
jgi:4-diphosphocytidyl-2-C-methyl-D-erythritol kinase